MCLLLDCCHALRVSHLGFVPLSTPARLSFEHGNALLMSSQSALSSSRVLDVRGSLVSVTEDKAFLDDMGVYSHGETGREYGGCR